MGSQVSHPYIGNRNTMCPYPSSNRNTVKALPLVILRAIYSIRHVFFMEILWHM